MSNNTSNAMIRHRQNAYVLFRPIFMRQLGVVGKGAIKNLLKHEQSLQEKITDR